jgi:NADH:ubiquinone oxidoreductase subunit 3 (subunit A)
MFSLIFVKRKIDEHDAMNLKTYQILSYNNSIVDYTTLPKQVCCCQSINLNNFYVYNLMFVVIIDITYLYLYMWTVVQWYSNYENDHNYKCFYFFFSLYFV